MTINNFLLLALLIIANVVASAQNTSRNYTNLDEALNSPDKVETLTLSARNLDSFPAEILRLRNLKYLDLSDNNITSLPEDIGVLSKLFYLDLSGNKLSSLPQPSHR
jgi:Leucine-rich repeat (LRR) protein